LAIYLFEAVMFPTIFSLALRGLGSLTKTASSILMMTPVGGCGFLLVGVIADATNLVIPFVIPMLCYIIVGLYGFGLVVPGNSQKA
jgi:FHS family L-fucose permease-like MFS transporter